MRRLLREIAKLSANQWLTLISLLVLVNMIVMSGLFWFIVTDRAPDEIPFTQLVLAQAPATRTPLPTFTVVVGGNRGNSSGQQALALIASPTSTLVPTWTPSITPTPLPTNTPTVTPTPLPTNTPVAVAQVRAAAPTATHTAAPTPTPNVDFAASVRQLTPCENQGKHHIFIYVQDQAGNGIPGVSVKVSWNGGEAIVETGTKAEDPGLTDFAMFKGSYVVEVLGALSEVAGPVTPDIPKDELCKENGNTVANSLFHYSYDITFTKVR